MDGNVKYGNNLTNVQIQRLKKLLLEYRDCFSFSLHELGYTKITEMVIRLNDSDPIVTDCNALRSIFAKRDLIPKISRWWIQFLVSNFVRGVR